MSAKRRRIAGEPKPAIVPQAPASEPARSRFLKPTVLSKPAPVAKDQAKEAAPQLESGPSPSACTPSADQAVAVKPPPQVTILQVGLAVVAMLSLVCGAFFGVRGYQSWRDQSSVNANQAAAAKAAGSAAETIFTYRFDQLAEYERESKSLMTPSFAKKFETISPALSELAPQRKIQLKATTRAASAVDCLAKCAANKVTVLIFLDQARLADGSKEPTVFGNRITMTMTKSDKNWLVSDVTAL